MIELDPASVAIGYSFGTLLAYYLNQTLNAKESEYERENDGATEKDFVHYRSSIYGWSNNGDSNTLHGKQE